MRDELARLAERQDVLIRGVAQMNETLALLGAMMEQVLDAATQPLPESGLGETLRRMVRLLTGQHSALTALDDRLAGLPRQIAEALGEEPGPS